MTTIAFLKHVMRDPDTHAKWLNSLSYLEYRGFRKIARSQTTDTMTLEMLTHASEEIRHALFFKRQAIKMGGQLFESYADCTLLSSQALKAYFYDLDYGVAKHLEQNADQEIKASAYCLITWLIERRAMSVYRQYNDLLKSQGYSFTLTAVLNEESQHLEQMAKSSEQHLVRGGAKAEIYLDIEEHCFRALWKALEIYVSVPHKSNISTLALE